MKINNIKKDTQKTEAIRNLFNKEIPTYARKLRKAEDVFIENIYNEILTEEWMKIVDNKLEPLKLHEKIYLITEADTLEDLMDMLIFEKHCHLYQNGRQNSYNCLIHHVIGIKDGEGYLNIDSFEDYIIKKHKAELDELIQEEIEEFKKVNPGDVEDSYISYYSIIADIMDNPIYNFRKYRDSVDAYGAMMRWVSETMLDKERLFNHFDLDTVKLKQSVDTLQF